MIEWNVVRYVDCMDKKIGLPSLPAKSIDFCFTDPPFNIQYAKDGFQRKKQVFKVRNKLLYEDMKTSEEYKQWCEAWFVELKRVCNVVIIYCGAMNLAMWHEIESPYDILYLYRNNSPSGGRTSYIRSIFPLVVYGKPKNRVKKDCFEYMSEWGFLAKYHCIHPCPLSYDFWLDLISQFKPESVIDIFNGSGVTSSVCEELGIKWLAYEINKEYDKDFQARLKRLKKKQLQQSLESFL